MRTGHPALARRLLAGRGMRTLPSRRSPALALLALAALLPIAAERPAAAGEIAASASTLGAGVEVTLPFAERMAVRLGAHAFSRSEDREASGIRYDAEGRWRNGSLLLDWHPFAAARDGGFRLTGGVLLNGNEVEGTSVPDPDGTYTIGDVKLPASLVGHLHAKVTFDRVAPYAALGWSGGGRVRVGFELGAVYQGRPAVDLALALPADSPIASNPALRAALDHEVAIEEAQLEHEVGKYDVYPVVALGLGVSF